MACPGTTSRDIAPCKMTTLTAQLNVPSAPKNQSVGLIKPCLDPEKILTIKTTTNTTNATSLINAGTHIQSPVINFTFTTADLRPNLTPFTTQTVNSSFGNITVTRDMKSDTSQISTIQKPIIVTVSGLSGLPQGNKQLPVISSMENSVIAAPVQGVTFSNKFIPITNVVQSGDKKTVFPQNYVSVPSTNVPVLPKPCISTSTLIPPPPTLTSVIPPTSFSSIPVSYSTFPPTVSPSSDISPLAFTVPVTPVEASQPNTISVLPVINAASFQKSEEEPTANFSPLKVTLSSLDPLITKIEPSPNNNQNDPTSTDYDPIKAMEWKDGIATLPGSDLKFKLSEFGTLEVITDEHDVNTDDVSNEEIDADDSKTLCTVENKRLKQDLPKLEQTESSDKQKSQENSENEKVCTCENCGCDGLLNEFISSGQFCSESCSSEFSKKCSIQKKGNSNSVISKKGLIEGQKYIKIIKTEPFSWINYLEKQNAVRAPAKLFRDYQSFPTSKNGFRTGMKLEGIDPRHPSMFCVLSVAEIRGYRIRLHFDGYSDCYDFWVNADSPDIFPVGWCEKTNHHLHPPKGYEPHEFNWKTYLKTMKAQAASRQLFPANVFQVTPTHGFKRGMKLEAVDKKNSSLICVATVSDVLENRFLVHFDGWEDDYDYWTDPTSPFIHPVNWCSEFGHVLTPPKNCKDTTFNWKDYLLETKSQAVPASAFKQRPSHGFKVGMKLEAVDKRNPLLIRVATVAEVQPHLIKLHFDGWSDAYDYWVDDDSLDIHPVNWCTKTGHPLQRPINSNNLITQGQGGCPTPGCKGIGHIKGPKYTSHHSAFGCPYSQLNMNKDTALQDRLDPPRNLSDNVVDLVRKNTDTGGTIEALRRCPTPGCDGSGHIDGRYSVHHRVSGCPLAQSQADIANGDKDDSRDSDYTKSSIRLNSGRGRKRKLLMEDKKRISVTENTKSPSSTLEDSIHKSVFSAPPVSDPQLEQPYCWEQHTKFLPGINMVTGETVSKWSVDEVANYVSTLSGCEEHAQLFKEEIDGEAFLLLNQTDIVKILNIKLGPALKIHNSILSFKKNFVD
ncbi:lethal(3)malignant brain tumor-like protein 4 isoform X2 [Centruroides vittatus]|uniref:lethal(3)malignant brain tumor-like protein 4 isoform X2 n=1 Tax=Centruroides vittatus TaxID=120091 RepID=UPI00350EF775